VLATTEVGVHLAWKECIFRDVSVSRILVEWEEEKPCHADYDEEGGDVWWEFEDAMILSQRVDGCCCGLVLLVYVRFVT
jgi:hypothetical protein